MNELQLNVALLKLRWGNNSNCMIKFKRKNWRDWIHIILKSIQTTIIKYWCFRTINWISWNTTQSCISPLCKRWILKSFAWNNYYIIVFVFTLIIKTFVKLIVNIRSGSIFNEAWNLWWIVRTWCFDIFHSIFTSRSWSDKVPISFRNTKRASKIGNNYRKLNIKLNTINRNC
jgi:hypothetical protein